MITDAATRIGPKMIELIKLIETNRETIEQDFTRWFANVPAASWSIISDYCIDNPKKQNDGFSFVVQLPRIGKEIK